jgi:hypothetical protein
MAPLGRPPLRAQLHVVPGRAAASCHAQGPHDPGGVAGWAGLSVQPVKSGRRGGWQREIVA